MSPRLNISTHWEHLESGSAEECACFAALGIEMDNRFLTDGVDGFAGKQTNEPLLSTYHLAQWFVWNWWRLRWEPRSSTADWAFAHRMATIGEGYVWPNITIWSDGERTALIAKPTPGNGTAKFRYIADYTAIMPSNSFQKVIDAFVTRVRDQLRKEQISSTNLDHIWDDLIAERNDATMTRRRKLEALLGHEPGEADETLINQLIEDSQSLGPAAVDELAADRRGGTPPPRAEELHALAKSYGFATSSKDAVSLKQKMPPPRGEIAAWKLGAELAHALRIQEQLGDTPISNERLAEFVGATTRFASEGTSPQIFSFAYDKWHGTEGRIVLRSRSEGGRRFELARLLADRLYRPTGNQFHAATRAYTYSQKLQRSFAAELLSPFEAVKDMLDGDYSSENQSEIAKHFGVSDWTVTTLLVNHRVLNRDELDEELGAVA